MAYHKTRRRRSSSRKSSPRRTTRTRRRIGGISTRAKRDSMPRLAGLVAGAVATGLINKMVGKMAKPLDPKIVCAGEVIIGYFLPNFIKGDLVAGIGDGMVAAGGLGLLHEFNVINGIPIIAGWRELNTVNGVPKKVTPRELSTQNSYRPSVSQVMNGIYYRRPLD